MRRFGTHFGQPRFASPRPAKSTSTLPLNIITEAAEQYFQDLLNLIVASCDPTVSYSLFSDTLASDEPEEEVKQVYEPTDRTRIINRLLNLSKDYDFINVSLSSQPNEIVVRIQVPDFDPSEMRAIKEKQTETGFISVNELMQLQKAGFRRPREVAPKPAPKNRREARQRAMQRIFNG